MGNLAKYPIAQKPLTQKQQKAILLLTSGLSAEEISKKLNIAVGTIYNWKSQNNEFANQLRDAIEKSRNEGIKQLSSLISASANTLRSIMTDCNLAPRDRIAAARTVLQFTELSVSEPPTNNKHANRIDYFMEKYGLA